MNPVGGGWQIASPHSSLGDRARLHLKKKKIKEWVSEPEPVEGTPRTGCWLLSRVRRESEVGTVQSGVSEPGRGEKAVHMREGWPKERELASPGGSCL